jgi:arsenite methyltransferase
MTMLDHAPDLMRQTEIRDVVREAYRSIPAGAGPGLAARLYDEETLAALPRPAITWALGVGDPVREAGLTAGEVVLDLGCGGGVDSILAARRVAPAGRVIGVDLLPEMCERARSAAAAADVGEVCEFRVGEMEALPVADDAVDVVISNGVLNLSPRKSRALAEVARVLTPGGRLCLADLAVEQDLPPQVLASGAAWAGCIAGAVSERVLAAKLARAGFEDVEVVAKTELGIDDVALYPLFTEEVLALMRRTIPRATQDRIATVVQVRAELAADSAAGAVGTADEPTHVAHLDRLAPTETSEAPGVAVRPLKRVEDVELKVLDVEPGGSTPYHRHPHAHQGVVVSGHGAVRLVEGHVPLEPGSVFYVRPNEQHAIECRADVPLRFVCMDCFV